MDIVQQLGRDPFPFPGLENGSAQGNARQRCIQRYKESNGWTYHERAPFVFAVKGLDVEYVRVRGPMMTVVQ
jgi:hypothetical protein